MRCFLRRCKALLLFGNLLCWRWGKILGLSWFSQPYLQHGLSSHHQVRYRFWSREWSSRYHTKIGLSFCNSQHGVSLKSDSTTSLRIRNFCSHELFSHRPFPGIDSKFPIFSRSACSKHHQASSVLFRRIPLAAIGWLCLASWSMSLKDKWGPRSWFCQLEKYRQRMRLLCALYRFSSSKKCLSHWQE